MRYYSLALLLFFALSSIGQLSVLEKEQVALVFDRINKSDASNIKHPEIRNEIFVKNFDTIIGIIKSQGFPYYQNSKKLMKSIESGARRTFIHILQTKPSLLLNMKTIELIAIEVSQNRLSNEMLKYVLQTFQYDTDNGRWPEWDIELSKYFYLAIQEWDIKLYPISKK